MPFGTTIEPSSSEQLMLSLQHVATGLNATISITWQDVTDRATGRSIAPELLDKLATDPPEDWTAAGGRATYQVAEVITPTP